MILVAIALALVWFPGPSPKKADRSRARDALATLLVAAATTPLALYVNGAFHPSSTLIAGIEAGFVALGLALAARTMVG